MSSPFKRTLIMDERDIYFLTSLCLVDNEKYATIFYQNDTILDRRSIDISLEEEDYAFIKFQKQRIENLKHGIQSEITAILWSYLDE